MAHSLDDRSFVTRLDPKGMLELTRAFSDQCRTALELANQAELPEPRSEPSLVILTGMGGSAAGGDFVKALFEAEGGVPFLVNRDYLLPHYAGPDTLVIAVSYSGNTEETLSAYQDARKKGCEIAVVTSGGKLAEWAARDEIAVIKVPGGQPPRTALGFLLIPVVELCHRFGLLSEPPYGRAFEALDNCASKWGMSASFEENPAKQLAQNLQGKIPILYGLGGWQGAVAGRWKAQINENSKNHAFYHAFPELNHNEILGWVECRQQNADKWAVVLLHDGSESEKLKARARVSFELIGDRADFYEASAQGTALLERMLTLTFLGDWTSIYLAALNGVDPENIDWLNHLKAELAKID